MTSYNTNKCNYNIFSNFFMINFSIAKVITFGV